ncbi:MAG: hypothetical protein WCG25_06095 [bacterium]
MASKTRYSTALTLPGSLPGIIFTISIVHCFIEACCIFPSIFSVTPFIGAVPICAILKPSTKAKVCARDCGVRSTSRPKAKLIEALVACIPSISHGRVRAFSVKMFFIFLDC